MSYPRQHATVWAIYRKQDWGSGRKTWRRVSGTYGREEDARSFKNSSARLRSNRELAIRKLRIMAWFENRCEEATS
jgi:hypothetical protein